jgi:hypothetical protein
MNTIDWVILDYNLMGVTRGQIIEVLSTAVMEDRLLDTHLFRYEGFGIISDRALEIINKDIKITFRMKIRKVILRPVLWLTLIGLHILKPKSAKINLSLFNRMMKRALYKWYKDNDDEEGGE